MTDTVTKKLMLFFPKCECEKPIIYHLVKEQGMTLKGAKKKMKENKEDTEHNFEIIKSLESIKDMLIEVRESL